MDTARDLACPALWQESLERSLARRGRPTRSSAELFHLRAERDLSRPELLRESLMYSQLRRSATARRPSMAVPGAGGISALALLAATTLPGLLGGSRAGAHTAVGYRADASDTRLGLANSPAAGSATGKHVAPRATGVGVATSGSGSGSGSGFATSDAAPVAAAVSAAAEPSHAVAARTIDHPAPASPHASTTATTRHIAVAHDAAGHGVRKSVAHALSGGAAPVAPKLAVSAPRVPAEPQPIGHPSTGGSAIEAASHTKTAIRTPQAPVHSGGATTGANPVAVHPVKPTTSQPVTAGHPKPVAASHPKPVTATHAKPVAPTHPVSTAKPAPKAPAPTPPAAPAGHYVNPLAAASVTPERIDQGVDYAGSGTLGAIGDGTVTYVATSGTGWPGAFVEYRLTGGPDAGRYVYYAEGVSPAPSVHVGETLQAGQPVARLIPGSSSGIEIGWGSGVGTQALAQADGHWSGGDDGDSVPSPEGKDFSALIASLGGPPGKIEG